MKKLSLIIALLLSFTLIFVSCGDVNSVTDGENIVTDDDANTDDGTEPEVTEPVTPEVVNVAAL